MSSRLHARPKRAKVREPASALTRRRRIPVALAAIFALAVIGTSFPFSTLLSQHRELSAAAAQLRQIQSNNRSLAEQDQQLSSNAEIDRLARQEYQLVMPDQTLYDVLPPSGGETPTPGGGRAKDATAQDGSARGDPGDQPLVAPADAPDMSPDPGLPQTAAASGGSTGSARSGAAGGIGSRSAGGQGAASGPSSFWSRVAGTLEFWK